MAPRELVFPNFLIIGAERCATRWLRFNLDQHPDIYLPPKDLNFFSDAEAVEQRGSLKAYSALFDGRLDESIFGESSPSYMAWNNYPVYVSQRIKKYLPDVRLIAIIREPVDRMYSALLHQIKLGNLPPEADLFRMVSDGDEAVSRFGLLGNGNYAAVLFPYIQRFGDQLKVILLDDVREDPYRVYEEVLRFIGADPTFVPRQLDKVMWSDRQSVRATGPVPTLLYRQCMYFYFRNDVEDLEGLIGRDLSSWDPGEWGDHAELLDQRYDVV